VYAGRGGEYCGSWFDQPTLFVRYYNIQHLLGDEEVDISGLGRVSCQRTLAIILYGFLAAAAAGFFRVAVLKSTLIQDLIIFLVIRGICGALLGFLKPEGVL
jgi:hypothetical protein